MDAAVKLLRDKPWATQEPSSHLLRPVGMVGPKERACYYWLARNWLSGRGAVVDAGSFLGASTFCFAAGAEAAGYVEFNGRPAIHAYDYFKVVDEYVGEAISHDFRSVKAGDSYFDIFLSQTARYRDLIEPHSGDFLGETWHGDPIEILFIDIAKTEALNAHAVAEFFPSLIPGRSVLVHQDYFHCWHPYIHIGMEFFADEFELIDEHVPHQSRIWRLAKALPAEKIARMAAYDLTKEERVGLLNRQIGKSSSFYKPMIKVVKIWQHCLDGDWVLAKGALAALRDEHDLDGTEILWAKQALDIERTMARHLL